MISQAGYSGECVVRYLSDAILHLGDEGFGRLHSRSGVTSTTGTVQDRVDPLVIKPDVFWLSTVLTKRGLGCDDDAEEVVHVGLRTDAIAGHNDDQTNPPFNNDQVYQRPLLVFLILHVEQGTSDTSVVRLDQHSNHCPAVGREVELLTLLEEFEGLGTNIVVGLATLVEDFSPEPRLSKYLVVRGVQNQEVLGQVGMSNGDDYSVAGFELFFQGRRYLGGCSGDNDSVKRGMFRPASMAVPLADFNIMVVKSPQAG